MSEYINNMTRRKEILREVLIQLHQGKPLSEVKALFSTLAQDVSDDEIAQAEQLLIEEGLPVEEIQRLCDVHVAVFQDGLDDHLPPESIPGHPVHTFTAENEVLLRFIQQMSAALQSYRSSPDGKTLATFRFQLEKLREFERHYLRKEMLLFPFLESYGLYGPSKVMWGIHDEIRLHLRSLAEWLLDAGTGIDPGELEGRFQAVVRMMQEMAYKEEKILFPACLEHLSEDDWSRIRLQEDEIGYFLVVPGRQWAAQESTAQGSPIERIHGAAPEPSAPEKPSGVGELLLNTGMLTLDQVDLLLRSLPVDVTFVDEQDKVRYFSQTRERIFNRTPAIIGREVQNCHPPQSVARVQQILDDFRAGRRESAEFWINFTGRMIHIRYFALRDEHGSYRGTIEVTQDITGIRALEGERRLLDMN
jgi:DUF438 domain-containing protein